MIEMIEMIEAKFCSACKWSTGDNGLSTLYCQHPIVNSHNPGALSRSINNLTLSHNTSCYAERSTKGWFSKCGLKGKLFEQK